MNTHYKTITVEQSKDSGLALVLICLICFQFWELPMLMLLGISPEMSTAAYRVGDSATNIITPLMVYFPLILIFCQRWQKDFGLGSLAATMLPYSIGLMVVGLGLAIVKRICHRFGWKLYIDSKIGEGTTVQLHFDPSG